MLVLKRSVGITLEVNLRDELHTGDKRFKQGIHPGFETQRQMSKNKGIRGPIKRNDVLKIIFF